MFWIKIREDREFLGGERKSPLMRTDGQTVSDSWTKPAQLDNFLTISNMKNIVIWTITTHMHEYQKKYTKRYLLPFFGTFLDF